MEGRKGGGKEGKKGGRKEGREGVKKERRTILLGEVRASSSRGFHLS